MSCPVHLRAACLPSGACPECIAQFGQHISWEATSQEAVLFHRALGCIPHKVGSSVHSRVWPVCITKIKPPTRSTYVVGQVSSCYGLQLYTWEGWPSEEHTVTILHEAVHLGAGLWEHRANFRGQLARLACRMLPQIGGPENLPTRLEALEASLVTILEHSPLLPPSLPSSLLPPSLPSPSGAP